MVEAPSPQPRRGDIAGDLHRPRVGLILEQTLGHITHADNLTALVGRDGTIDPVFAPIDYEVEGWAARVPGYGNWTVRAGLRARRAIRALERGGSLDALFIHSQVPAILVPDQLRRTPTVVSLDATPIQYDELGAHYGHTVGSDRAEALKLKMQVRCFARARRVVAWAEWTKSGLVDRYEVPPEKVEVIPPGVRLDLWTDVADGRAEAPAGAPMRILFVGGDLQRKGGLVLLEAVRRLRHDGVAAEVDLVTRDDIVAEPGVTVHHGLQPNSPELIELYHRADVFCLPTLGDCLPMVLSEAGAARLPLVSTDVGAIGEIVHDGQTGLLVPPNDSMALAAALGRLAADLTLRRRLGDEAQRIVRRDFDAATNASRLCALLVAVANGERR